MRRFLISAAAVLISLVGIGAGPTTQPRKQLPIPSNWPTVVNKTYHFQYRVPSLWKALRKNDTMTEFDLPKSSEPNEFGRVDIQAGQCPVSTLADDVAQLKQALLQLHSGGKIVTDKATTLVDKPAWIIVCEVPYKTKAVKMTGNRQEIVDVTRTKRHMEFIAVQDGKHYVTEVVGDSVAYNKAMPQIEQMLASFQFEDAPKAK